jgi:hypothetical protein
MQMMDDDDLNPLNYKTQNCKQEKKQKRRKERQKKDLLLL